MKLVAEKVGDVMMLKESNSGDFHTKWQINFFMEEGDEIDADELTLVETLYEDMEGNMQYLYTYCLKPPSPVEVIYEDDHNHLSDNPIVNYYMINTDKIFYASEQETLERFAEFLVSKNAYEMKINEAKIQGKSDAIENLLSELNQAEMLQILQDDYSYTFEKLIRIKDLIQRQHDNG